MRLFLVFLFCGMVHSYSNGQVSGSCIPTINIKAAVYPNGIDSGFSCPPSTDCISGVKAKDNRFQVVSFKLSANKLCDLEGGAEEAVNMGAVFNVQSKNIVLHTCEGSVLEFTCIKAKTKDGLLFILQPFSVTIE